MTLNKEQISETILSRLRAVDGRFSLMYFGSARRIYRAKPYQIAGGVFFHYAHDIGERRFLLSRGGVHFSERLRRFDAAYKELIKQYDYACRQGTN